MTGATIAADDKAGVPAARPAGRGWPLVAAAAVTAIGVLAAYNAFLARANLTDEGRG